jgi:hypothetical protein
MKLREMQTDYGDEYNKLSKEDKDELVEEFKSIKKAASTIRHPTACSRLQDVTNVVRNMELLVQLQFSCSPTQ